MKHNLTETTFIIPIRIESADRMRNAITSIIFLLENFDTNVIVKEGDTEPVFARKVLPQIMEYFGEEFESLNLKVLFEKTSAPEFHRTRYLNEMLQMVDTPVVVNYDCDIILPIETYIASQESITRGECDVVYPYAFGNGSKLVNATDELVTEFLTEGFDYDLLDKNCKVYMSRYGFCQFFSTEAYKDGGMENEKFIAYAPEDEERFYRFDKLGYKVGRVDNFVYHLEHSRTPNSWLNNPHMKKNFELWEEIQKMTTEELREYYSWLTSPGLLL